MPVTCRLKCEKPEEIEYTLTVTMKASEWEKLRNQLDANYTWPASDVVRYINDMLAQARKIYWPKAAGEAD